MYIKQISILALGLILSHESFAANPVIRAGALRLNTSSSTQSTQSVTNPSSTTGAVASYERASRLRPNRVQIGAPSGGAANNANTELLNAVYAEMERVTNAVEQELYVTQKQIDDLKEEIKEHKEEIEERDEKIQELEEALVEYEDLKETVKNIPSLYYTKREVDAKGYVLPKTMENAINVAKTSAINSARDQAVAEIENKGFITANTVYQDIAVAKDKAIENATESALVAVNNMGFVTVEKLNEVVSTERVARQDALKSYATKEQLAATKTAAIDNAVAVVDKRNFATISAVNSAVNSAVANIRQDRENALKPYVTKTQLATDIANAKNAAVDVAVAAVDRRGFATESAVDKKLANLKLGVDNETVTSIVDNRINARNFATISAVNSAVANIRQERENALKPYVTKVQLAADIASLRTAAINDAVAAVDRRGFATESAVDKKLANLELGVDSETVTSIVDNRINARNFATISAVDSAVQKATLNIRGERENALKPYVTKAQLATDIATARTAAINDAVAVVDKRDFIKQATAYEIFATKIDLNAVDNKFKNISNTIAVDLAQNDRFKAQVLDGLDSSISELPSKVTRIETKIASMDKELFIDSVPKFAKQMDEFRQTLQYDPTKIIGREKLIDAEYVAGKLPATVCRSKDCLTSMIGDHYTTDSKVALKLNNYTKTDDLGNLQLIKNMNTNISNNTNKFANYTSTSDMNTAIDRAKNAAVTQAATERATALNRYATQSWVDDKGYATQSWVNNAIETKMADKGQQTPVM